MAHRPTYLKKSVKLQVEKLERKCRYCKTHRNMQGFDKHEAWCKKTWIIRRELQELHSHSMTGDKHVHTEAANLISSIISSSLTYFDASDQFVGRF
jgi:hypothetical protein